MQRTDAPARNLRAIWLGPDNAWRWPWDWTFDQWAVFAALSLLAGVLYGLAVPLAVVVAAVLVVVSKRVAAASGWGSRGRWAGAAFTAALLVGIYPDPRGWLLPMPWWLAPVVAVATAARLVSRVGRHIDGNRPLAYWRRALRLAATGPRPARPPVAGHAVDPAGLAGLAGPAGEPLDLQDLHYAALAAEEAPMPLFRPIVATVEAERWLPADTGRAGAFCAWLAATGAPVRVDADTVTTAVDGRERLVRPGSWAVLGPDGRLTDVLPDAVFTERYEPAADPDAPAVAALRRRPRLRLRREAA